MEKKKTKKNTAIRKLSHGWSVGVELYINVCVYVGVGVAVFSLDIHVCAGKAIKSNIAVLMLKSLEF